MSWTIILESESGGEIEVLDDEMSSKFYDKFQSYRLIKYLDISGDLTINRMQLDDLGKDIQDYMKENKEAKDLGVKILQLIEKSRNTIHSYIKFYGE